jgi:hypothetical protein
MKHKHIEQNETDEQERETAGKRELQVSEPVASLFLPDEDSLHDLLFEIRRSLDFPQIL